MWARIGLEVDVEFHVYVDGDVLVVVHAFVHVFLSVCMRLCI